MRLQLHVSASDIGVSDPIAPQESAALVERVLTLLTNAGFVAKVESDHAAVDPDMADWAYLTAAEREAGGFDYPEVVVDGPAAIIVSVFRRSVLFASQPDFAAEQEATSQVVRALRAIADVMPVSSTDWSQIESAAAAVAVGPDGTILREVLSSAEVEDRALALFDHAHSPERPRPHADTFAERISVLEESVSELPPFRAAIATSPDAMSFGLKLPSGPPFSTATLKPFRIALKGILTDAVDASHERTGIPTGIIAEHDAAGTRGAVIYDNLVDGAVLWPVGSEDKYRSAPWAWESITIAAARRDPAFQPSWLPDAVALLAEGGTDVEIRRDPRR